MTLRTQKIIAIAAVLVGGVIFLTTLVQSTLFVTSDDIDTEMVSTSVATSSHSNTLAGVPTRIRIPSIDVDANVAHVGLGKTGNMAVPLSYAEVGWYHLGTIPGDVGSAVIDGHVDNGFGLPAVFANLGKLKTGDDIYIDTKEGGTLHFVVESAATYPVSEVPLQKLFNRKDTVRLNLITCQGEWLAEEKMYDERHVVYAVLVD